MAEQFAKQWLRDQGYSNRFEVVSRGLTEDYEPAGSPASAHGISVLKEEYGIISNDHVSAILTQEEATRAVAIVGVSRSHAQHVNHLFPSADITRKTTSLDRDIYDPWHQSYRVYQTCAEAMKPLVEAALVRIVAK